MKGGIEEPLGYWILISYNQWIRAGMISIRISSSMMGLRMVMTGRGAKGGVDP
jgi:hypothetical protein